MTSKQLQKYKTLVKKCELTTVEIDGKKYYLRIMGENYLRALGMDHDNSNHNKSLAEKSYLKRK